MFLNTILEETNGELDYSFESDIVDQHCIEDNNAHFSFEHEVPSRPSSRLSFNRDTIDRTPFSEDEVSDNAYSEGGYPPFLPVLTSTTMSVNTKTGTETTSLALRGEASPSLLCEWGSGLAPNDPCIISDGEDSDIETEIDSDCSSYSDFDDETPSPPSPPSSPPLIHDFSPPLQESDWSLRPKFSCLPSPLSPSHIPLDPYSLRQNPTRHYYGNHGLSRHALHHLKWFWAAREDEWVEHKARLYASKPYERLSIFDDILSDQRLPSGCAPPGRDVANRSCSPSPRAAPLLPPLSIHPRRGDCYALRDPYCAHIDRYFVGMPVWTMSKTLWMFDVHAALERGCDTLEETEEGARGGHDPYDEDQNAVELTERSVSVGFSDDSDSTLVESDNEGEVSMSERLVDIVVEGVPDVLDDGKSKSDLSPAPPLTLEAESSLVSPFVCGVKSKSSLLEGEILGLSKLHPCNVEARGCWPKNWYGRWQVLLRLCLEKDLPHDALPPLPFAGRRNVSVTLPVRPKARKFFIPDDEEDWHEETDGDSMGKKNTLTSRSKDASSCPS